MIGRYFCLGLGVASIVLGLTVFRYDATLLLQGVALALLGRQESTPWSRHPSIRG